MTTGSDIDGNLNFSFSGVLTPKRKKVFIKDFVRKWIEEKRRDPHTIKLLSDIHYDLVKPLAEAGFDIDKLRPKQKKRRRETITVRYPKDICDELGITRASIGLYTGDVAHMYFRGQRYSINIAEIPRLQHVGTDILIIEKEGIAERLRRYFEKTGIALVHSRGFLTEYASDLSIMAEENGGHIYTLTDFDVSGLLIAHKVEDVPRIGIDLQTLEDFGITEHSQIARLTDYVTPDKHHLKHIEDNYPEDLDVSFDLQHERIEINAVLNLVEVQRFGDWIVEKIKEENYVRDWNRAVRMPQAHMFRPPELDKVIGLIEGNIAGVLTPLVRERQDELAESEDFIENIDAYEDDLYYEFLDEIHENTSNDKIVKSLRRILEKYDGHGRTAPP
jgi:hypothetical protein